MKELKFFLNSIEFVAKRSCVNVIIYPDTEELVITEMKSEIGDDILVCNIKDVNHFYDDLALSKVTEIKNRMNFKNLAESYLFILDEEIKKGKNIIFLNPAGSDPKGIEIIVDYYLDKAVQSTIIIFLGWSDYVELFEIDRTLSFVLDDVKHRRKKKTIFKVNK